MDVWAYLNGEFVPDRDAVVSVHDRGLRYGDGVFDTIRVYDGQPFLLERHVNRLLEGAASLGLSRLPAASTLMRVIEELIERNGLREALVRATLTRGASEGWTPDDAARPTIIIIQKPFAGYPEDRYARGASIVIAETVYAPAASPTHAIKSLNYLTRVQAKREAMARGADEAVLCTEAGLVVEGSVSNIFCVDDGRVRTPAASLGLLSGITRAIVIDLARREGLPCEEALLTSEDLRQADEILLTNTGMETLPVTAVNGLPIGGGRPGPIGTALRRWYRTYVSERLSARR